MKNKILAVLLAVTLVGVMTACGNSSEGDSTDTSTAQSSGSATDSEAKNEDTMLGSDSAAPVSYTHLDVYKRQDRWTPARMHFMPCLKQDFSREKMSAFLEQGQLVSLLCSRCV